MKAILIDAVEQVVREVEYDGLLESAYSLLRCELVDVVGLPCLSSSSVSEYCGNDLFVDDEGLLAADSDDAEFFVLRCGYVFAGSGLVVGQCDENGNTTPTTLTADYVRDHVAFATRLQLRMQGVDPRPGIGFISFG